MRRANGEGTIYRRKDGRYEGAGYFRTASGALKRVRVYGRTRVEVDRKLTEARADAQRGAVVPDRPWTLSAYLDYWLETIVRITKRPKTYEQYEMAVRLYLKPGLGSHDLGRLTAVTTQAYFNQLLLDGHSVRKTQIIRTALSAALNRAVREELVSRNVARLVELPSYEPAPVVPWSADEAGRFLSAARISPLYAAFVLSMLYGLRRGEVLGLRWQDVDLHANQIHVRQQLQRVGRDLVVGPVKTSAGRRDLPVLPLLRTALTMNPKRAAPADLIFTTCTGGPIEPRNYVRSFWAVCARAHVRVIKLHHLRHTAATLLKQVGVPARDAQLILGHSQISITQQIYQHDDQDSRRDSLSRVERVLLLNANGSTREECCRQGCVRCRQNGRQPTWDTALFGSFLSGGPSGARTHDTLLKSPTNPSLLARATSIYERVGRCRRQWLLGTAAVSLAVRIDRRWPE